MRRWLGLILLAVLLLGAGLWWRGRLPVTPALEAAANLPKAPPGTAASVPVRTATVERRALPVEITAIGNVQPLATVAIRARIDSVVTAVAFTEGQEVHKGDLLFTLDRAPSEAQLRQAEGILARDQAQLDHARSDVRRYAELIKKDNVSRQQYDSATAAAAALEGTVRADAAAVETARLALSYTNLYAPIDGRTGAVLVRPGNVVRAADATALVVLTQMRPISVVFTAPERALAGIRAAAEREAVLPVRVTLGEQAPDAAIIGRLSFIDSSVDTASGTVRLKGEFANADTRLWPGQFVGVVLGLGPGDDTLAVPAEAVQIGANGPYLYRLTADGKVEARRLVTGRSIHGFTAVTDGVDVGDRVVIDGQSRLSPGTKVVVRAPPP